MLEKTKIITLMKVSFEVVKKRYQAVLTDRVYLLSLSIGVVLLSAVFLINFYAVSHATKSASNPVSDIILSNVPVFNLNFLVVYCPFIFWAFIGLFCLTDPKRIPFVLKSVALFVLIRSVFINLTQLGPFPDQADIDYTLRSVRFFTAGGDLFFSGHTGAPFLMALIFGRNNLFWRISFTAVAIFFGVVVLLAHVHYTIDVLAAFFITYTIYVLATKFFPGDAERFWR